MSSVNLGSLVLELQLDTSTYYQQLEQARSDALKAATEIESRFTKDRGLNLNLRAKVDDSELTALNKHLDLKQKHFIQTQNLFNARPLRPRVDSSELTQYGKDLDSLQRKDAAAKRSMSGSLTPNADLSEIKELSTALKSLRTELKETILYFEKNPIRPRVEPEKPKGVSQQQQQQPRPADQAATQQPRTVKEKIQVVVQQQKDTVLDKAADTVMSRVLERTLTPVVDLALEEGFTKVLQLTSSILKSQLGGIQYLGVGKVLGKEVDKLATQVQKTYAPEKGVSGRVEKVQKRVDKGVERVVTAPANILTAPIRGVLKGFYEGIGQTYGGRFGKGSADTFEKATGKSVYKMGAETGSFANKFTGVDAVNTLLNKVSKLGDIETSVKPILAKYGVKLGEGGFNLQDKALDIGAVVAKRVSPILDKSLDEKKIQADIDSAKNSLIGLGKAIALTNDQAAKAENLKELMASVRSLAQYPREAVIETYKQTAKASAQQLDKRISSPVTPTEKLPDGTKQVVFVSAGFSATQGKQSHKMAEAIKPYIAEGSHVVPFENREFEVNKDAATDGIHKWLVSVLDTVSDTMAKGYNPSAVRMAKEAYEYKQQNPDVGLKLIGHSAGGLIAKEAQAILKELGVDAEVLSMGTPNVGAFRSNTSRSLGLMGSGDMLKAANNEQTASTLQAVKGHELPFYIQDPKVQQAITDFTSKGVSPQLIASVESAEAAFEESAKSIEKASSALEKLADKVFAMANQPLPSETRAKVREGYKRAADEIRAKAERGELTQESVPAQAGFKASNLQGDQLDSLSGKPLPRVPSQLSADEAEQITLFVGGFGGVKGLESEYLGQELSHHLPKHHVVGVESPEFDVQPEPGQSVAHPSFLKKAYSTITGEASQTGEDAVAKRIAERAYQYYLQHPDKPINIMGQSGGGMPARGAAQILKELGVPDVRVVTSASPHFGASEQQGMTLVSNKDPFKQIAGRVMTNPVEVNTVEGHSKYYNADPQGKLGAKERFEQIQAGEAGIEVNKQVQAVLEAFLDRTFDEASALANAKLVAQTIQTGIEDVAKQVEAPQRKPVPPKPQEATTPKPVTSPVTPKIDEQLKANLMGLSKEDQKKIAKQLNITGASKLNKNDLSDRIIGTNEALARLMVEERDIINQLLEVEKEVTKALQDAEKLKGKNRSTALNQIRDLTVSQISGASNAMQGIQTPAFRSELGALKGRAEHRLNTSLAITAPQVEEERSKLQDKGIPEPRLPEVEGLARVTPQSLALKTLATSEVPSRKEILQGLASAAVDFFKNPIGSIKQGFAREKAVKTSLEDAGVNIPSKQELIKSVSQSVLKQLLSKGLKLVASEDTVVNTAGFLGSVGGGITGGPAGQLAGDLGGALLMRRAYTDTRILKDTLSQMKPDANLLRSASSMYGLSKERRSALQEEIRKNRVGDIAGWGIGNASASMLGATVPPLAGVPFKGAAVAMATVPKIVAADARLRQGESLRSLIMSAAQKGNAPLRMIQEGDERENLARRRASVMLRRVKPLIPKELGEVEGLARVNFEPSSEVKTTLVRTKNAFEKIYNAVTAANRLTAKNLRKNYEQIAKEVADLNGIQIRQGQIPELEVDSKRLRRMGVQAFYDVRQNKLIVSKEIQKILAKDSSALIKYSEDLKVVVHEMQHAVQFDFGALSVNKIAQGKQNFNVNLTPESIVSPRVSNFANLSVDAVERLAKKRGQRLVPQQRDVLKRAEVDAYAFEDNTSQILKNVNKNLGSQKGKDIGSVFKGLMGIIKPSTLGDGPEPKPSGGFLEKLTSKIPGIETFKTLGSVFNGASKGAETFGNAINGLITHIEEANPGVGKLVRGAKDFYLGMIGFRIVSNVVNWLKPFAQESLMAAVRLNNLKTALGFVSGSASQANKDLAFIQKTTSDLGIPLESAQRGYTKLAAATRGTAAEGQGTKDVFVGLSQAATVLGLSSEDVEGAFLALGQSASKGKVQAEELRGQLGERIPGAFGIAARAIGKTEAELNGMLERGEVIASDFLPKFGKQLQVEFGDAAKTAGDNVQSSMFRVQNSLLLVQQGFGQAFSPVAQASMNALNAILQGVAGNAEGLGKTFLLLGALIAGPLLAPLAKLIASGPVITAVVGALTAGLGALKAQLGTIAVQFALVTAAIETAKVIFSAFVPSELGNQFKGFADAGVSSLKRIEEAAKKARGEVEQVKPQRKEGGFDLTLGLSGMIGVGPVRTDKLINATNNKFGTSFRTMGDVQQERDVLAAQQFKDVAYKTSGLVLDNPAKIADSLRQAQSIEKQVADLQNKRSVMQASASPDKKALADIDGQISKLNQEKANATSALTETRSAITGQLANAKKALDAIDQQGLPVEDAKALRAPFEMAVKDLEAAQNQLDKLDKSIQTSNGNAKSLSATFADVATKLEQAQRTAQNTFNRQNIQINAQELSGNRKDPMAARKAAEARANAEVSRIQAEFEGQQDANKTLQNALNSNASRSVMSGIAIGDTGKTINIDSSLEEIEKARKKIDAGKDPQKADLLDRLKEYRENADKILETEKNLGQAKLAVQKEVEQTALAEIDRNAQKQESIVKIAENGKLAALKHRQALGNVSEVQAAEETARIQLQSVVDTEKNARAQAEALKSKFDGGLISAEEYEKRSRDIENSLSDLKLRKAEQELAVREAVNRKIIEGLELANRKAEAAIQLSQTARTTGVRQNLLSSGLTPDNEAKAQQQITAIEQDATRQRIELIKKQLGETKKLRSEGRISAKDATEKELQYQQQLADANSRVVDLEIEKQKQLQAEFERTIDKKVAAQKRATDLAVASYDREKAAADAYLKSLDIQSKLIDSRGQLQSAKAGVAQVNAQANSDRFGRALELRKKIDSEQDPTKKRNFETVLGSLGFGGQSEQQIIEGKQSAEDATANQAKAAKEAELAIQRQQLEIEIKRNALSAQMAISEAEIAKLKQQQLIYESQGNLQKALRSGDTEKIADAKAQLTIAQMGMDIADKQLLAAQQQAAAQKEIAQNSRDTLAAREQEASATASAADEARRYQQAMEHIDAGMAPNIKGSSGIGVQSNYNITATGVSIPGRAKGGPVDANQLYMVGEKGPELFVPSAGGSIVPNKQFEPQANTRVQTNYNISSSQSGGAAATVKQAIAPESLLTYAARSAALLEKIYEYTGHMASDLGSMASPAASTALMTQPTPQFNQVPTGNTPVGITQSTPGDKFDKLANVIMTVANQPRSLTVQSSQPTQDAAKIWADTRKAQTQSLGI